jgi:ribose/xylose/arabinose/galactoside ABC-type transport system permease subunit
MEKMKVNLHGNVLRKFGLPAVIVLMIIVMSIVSPVFLTRQNIINVLRQVSINGIMAVGLTLVILTGGIDLSVGALVAVTSVITGSLLLAEHSVLVSVLAGVAAALAFGIFSGTLIAVCGLPPFIATLATMTIGRGFALVYSNGRPYVISNKTFISIGQGSTFDIPNPIWILLVICVLAFILLNFTVFGRHIYAFGGNRQAARLAGVRTKLVEISVYVISGFLAGVAAIILSARIRSGQPTAGEGYGLDAIAATAIGGTSMVGGKGSVLGTVMGFIIIGVMSNALTLLNVSSFYQQIVKGVIIIVAVMMDSQTKRRRS